MKKQRVFHHVHSFRLQHSTRYTGEEWPFIRWGERPRGSLEISRSSPFGLERNTKGLFRPSLVKICLPREFSYFNFRSKSLPPYLEIGSGFFVSESRRGRIGGRHPRMLKDLSGGGPLLRFDVEHAPHQVFGCGRHRPPVARLEIEAAIADALEDDFGAVSGPVGERRVSTKIKYTLLRSRRPADRPSKSKATFLKGETFFRRRLLLAFALTSAQFSLFASALFSSGRSVVSRACHEWKTVEKDA